MSTLNGAENTVEVKRPRGRPKGSINRRSQHARDVCERLKIDPLEFLLAQVKNRRLPTEVRVDAAKACIGFVHPRLAAHQIAANVQIETEEQRVRFRDAVNSDPAIAKALEALAFKLVERPAAPVIDVTPEPLLLSEAEQDRPHLTRRTPE